MAGHPGAGYLRRHDGYGDRAIRVCGEGLAKVERLGDALRSTDASKHAEAGTAIIPATQMGGRITTSTIPYLWAALAPPTGVGAPNSTAISTRRFNAAAGSPWSNGFVPPRPAT